MRVTAAGSLPGTDFRGALEYWPMKLGMAL